MPLVIRKTNERNVHLEKKIKCGCEYHLIAKFLKPPKDNEKQQYQVRFNEKDNCAHKSSKNNDDQKIYASMARMYNNDECPSENVGDSSQLNNWILDSGAMCHMTS